MSKQPIDDRGNLLNILKPRAAKSFKLASGVAAVQTGSDFDSDIDQITVEADANCYIRLQTPVQGTGAAPAAACAADGTDKFLRAGWSYTFSLGGDKGKAGAQRVTRVSVIQVTAGGNVYISQDE